MSFDLAIIASIVLVGGGMIGMWWYSVAVLQPRVRQARYAIFQAYVQARGGQEMPLPNMDSLTIFDFFSDKARELERQAAQAHPRLGTQDIYADHQASITLGDHHGRVAFGEAGESDRTSTKIIFWQFELHGAVDGWARLRSEQSRFKGSIPEVHVESVKVNREVQIHAAPKKLAFSLFAPDVLDWYVHTSRQPWVYVEQDRLIVVFEAYPQPGIFEQLTIEVEYILKAIERSGALVKNASSA